MIYLSINSSNGPDVTYTANERSDTSEDRRQKRGYWLKKGNKKFQYGKSRPENYSHQSELHRSDSGDDHDNELDQERISASCHNTKNRGRTS